MPRHRRIKTDQLIYHVISRGNNKMTIFHDDRDYKSYLNILMRYKEKMPFALYHYCLMNNHVHLLLRPQCDISWLMHGINLSYAQYFKRRYSHIGHFWQDRFKSHIVSQDSYLLQCARYIETNPCRIVPARSLDRYPYSSYRFYACGQDSDLITQNPLYNNFGLTDTERRARYLQFTSEGCDAKLEIKQSQFIASEEYVLELLTTTLRNRIKRKRGRPRINPQKLVYNIL